MCQGTEFLTVKLSLRKMKKTHGKGVMASYYLRRQLPEPLSTPTPGQSADILAQNESYWSKCRHCRGFISETRMSPRMT